MPKKPAKKPAKKNTKKITKKRYIPTDKEKYMCVKHKQFFTEELLKWKKDIIQSNSLTNLLNSSDDNVSSADVVDQASSYTDKSVEMKALRRIKDETYGYCEETSEPIGLKRLIARPVATLSIEAQEKHERNEKIFIED